MKNIYILIITLMMFASISFAGNGNPPCHCNSTNQPSTFHAEGIATWVSQYEIKCVGTTGTCWSITFSGKWILTIYTEPPMVFDNHNPQDNPPLSPAIAERGDGYILYDIDPDVWK